MQRLEIDVWCHTVQSVMYSQLFEEIERKGVGIFTVDNGIQLKFENISVCTSALQFGQKCPWLFPMLHICAIKLISPWILTYGQRITADQDKLKAMVCYFGYWGRKSIDWNRFAVKKFWFFLMSNLLTIVTIVLNTLLDHFTVDLIMQIWIYSTT